MAEYWLRALRLHIAAQQYEGALRCYGKLVSVYGTAQVPPPVRIALAEAQVCLRNPGGAISILRTVLEEKTSASMRAEAAFRAGEIAAMHLQVQNWPDNTSAVVHFARTWRRWRAGIETRWRWFQSLWVGLPP